MNKHLPSRRGRPRRRIQYVDEKLQKIFLAGLVLLEATLAITLTWLMWQHLSQIVDDNLYRVHLDETPTILSQLMQHALLLLGLFFAANLMALVLVDLIWRRYVNAILRDFTHLMQKTQALDFTEDPAAHQRHQVLDLAESQRDKERQRLTEIRARLRLLPTPGAASNATAFVADAVHAAKRLLPRSPASVDAPAPERRRRSTDPI